MELQSLSKSKGYTEEWTIEKLRPDHCSVPGAKQEARWIQETLQQLEVKGEDGTDQIHVWELLHLVASDETRLAAQAGNDSESDSKSADDESVGKSWKGLEELLEEVQELEGTECTKRAEALKTKSICERAVFLLAAYVLHKKHRDGVEEPRWSMWNEVWLRHDGKDIMPAQMMAETLEIMTKNGRHALLDVMDTEYRTEVHEKAKALSPLRTVASMTWLQSLDAIATSSGSGSGCGLVTSGAGDNEIEAKENAAANWLDTNSDIEFALKWRRLETGASLSKKADTEQALTPEEMTPGERAKQWSSERLQAPEHERGEPGIIDSTFWLQFSHMDTEEVEKSKYKANNTVSTMRIEKSGIHKNGIEEGHEWYLLEVGTYNWYKMPGKTFLFFHAEDGIRDGYK